MKPWGFWCEMNLFDSRPQDNLIPQDGILNDFGCILDAQEAQTWLQTLLQVVPWQADEVVVMGKRITTARKVAWFGDAPYYYSGVLKQPLAWGNDMLQLKQLVEQHTGQAFNSCLANLYADGSQGVGWHSDDETVLGREPIIASLSLGASRRFCFKHKLHPSKTEIELQAGQLLLMHGALQRYWLHSIPKMLKVTSPRISLTFRQIQTDLNQTARSSQ